MRTMSNRKVLSFISIVLLLSMFLTGCRNYKSFSLTEGIGHFSFEYSPRYSLKIMRTEGINTDETQVVFETAIKSVQDIDAEIVVHIEKAGDIYKSSLELLDSIIKNLDRGFKGCEFKERFMKNIRGIQGEEIIFTFNGYILEDVPSNLDLVSTPATTKIMAFDHDGLIWYILMTSHDSYLSQAESDFDHILETFNIME
jgi:hypothetical protein